MAKCAVCNEDTILFISNVPICLGCAEGGTKSCKAVTEAIKAKMLEMESAWESGQRDEVTSSSLAASA
jgi:hypothetical protein